MLVFGEAVKKMGNLTWGEIGRGLTTMAGSLAAVTVAMNLLPKGMVSKATGMVEVGAALLIIGEAVDVYKRQNLILQTVVLMSNPMKVMPEPIMTVS